MNATSSIIVDAPPEAVFKAVLDPFEYRLADPRVTELVVIGGRKRLARLRVRAYAFSPWLESGAVTRVALGTRGRLDFEVDPKTISLPGRLFLGGYKGALLFEGINSGTRVTRNEMLILRDNPLGRLAARFGSGWLQEYLDGIAMPRLKQIIEARHRRG